MYMCIQPIGKSQGLVYGIEGFAIGLLLCVQKLWFQKGVLVTGLTHRASQELYVIIEHRHFQVLYFVEVIF